MQTQRRKVHEITNQYGVEIKKLTTKMYNPNQLCTEVENMF